MIGRQDDPEWGEAVVAYVVRRRERRASSTRCASSASLASSGPKDYVFVAALPKSSYGKILKTELRRLDETLQVGRSMTDDRYGSTGKTALVVGAGSSGPGLGQRQGRPPSCSPARVRRVFCVDLNRGCGARDRRSIIRAEGGEAEALQADASTRDRRGARWSRRAWSGSGASTCSTTTSASLRSGAWSTSRRLRGSACCAVNLTSCFLAMKHVDPGDGAPAARRGSIVNISSIASVRYTGVPVRRLLRDEGRHEPPHADDGRRSTRRQKHPRQRGPSRVDEDADGRADGRAASPTLRRRRRGDVAHARDAQCPMGEMGDAWDVAYAALFLASRRVQVRHRRSSSSWTAASP